MDPNRGHLTVAGNARTGGLYHGKIIITGTFFELLCLLFRDKPNALYCHPNHTRTMAGLLTIPQWQAHGWHKGYVTNVSHWSLDDRVNIQASSKKNVC